MGKEKIEQQNLEAVEETKPEMVEVPRAEYEILTRLAKIAELIGGAQTLNNQIAQINQEIARIEQELKALTPTETK